MAVSPYLSPSHPGALQLHLSTSNNSSDETLSSSVETNSHTKKWLDEQREKNEIKCGFLNNLAVVYIMKDDLNQARQLVLQALR